MNFWLLPLVHLLAVMSPGPDFFLILNHSLVYSRRGSLISSFGIACGCLIHMGTVIIALFFLEIEVEWVNNTLKILGSGYLIFLGISSLKEFIRGWFQRVPASVSTVSEEENLPHLDKNLSASPHEEQKKIHDLGFKSYFLKGFFCNLLNPKAWAYFFSIFTAISVEFSFSQIIVIALLFYIITQGWFSLVTVLFTIPSLQAKLENYRKLMSLLCGIAFCVLGISLALN